MINPATMTYEQENAWYQNYLEKYQERMDEIIASVVPQLEHLLKHLHKGTLEEIEVSLLYRSEYSNRADIPEIRHSLSIVMENYKSIYWIHDLKATLICPVRNDLNPAMFEYTAGRIALDLWEDLKPRVVGELSRRKEVDVLLKARPQARKYTAFDQFSAEFQ